MPAELSKTYDPAAVERGVAARWDAARAWHADPRATTDPPRGEPAKPPFSIVIPPPNVTAALHLGHALNNTLQDALVRFHRMRGFNACWLPGTDHAGIATQTVVDRRLKAEGKPALAEHKAMEERGEPGRERFVDKVQAWKDEYEARITEQLKAMGCSCDWDRQRFTMDDVCAKAVREAFFQLFKDGLIYRGKYLVNWDPVTQTALADDEVETQDVDGNFYYLRYPLWDPDAQSEIRNEKSEIQYVTVATTRPETMLGDTAVAVNPKDEPRARFIGKHVRLPIANRIIPIIADDYVVIPDPDSDDAKARMASGFLKVTPAHDPNDYEIGQRHGLPVVNVMAPDASISKDHGWPAEEWPPDSTNPTPASPDREAGVSEFAHTLLGLSREDARRAIVRWFKDQGLMAEVKPYRHAVGHSYRSHVPIEPYLSDQWYVAVKQPTKRLGDDESVIDGTDVPRNSLAGAALLTLEQSPDRIGPGLTSPDREGGVSDASPGTAYFITFSTYGSWLQGDERGSIVEENLPGTPTHPPQRGLDQHSRDAMSGDPVSLGPAHRRTVLDAVADVCRHRGWRLEAANIRTQHAHLVVVAPDAPERVLNDFKAYATRRLREAGLAGQDDRVWARHGSTRYLNDPASFDAAIAYVVDQQGEDLGAVFDGREKPLPHGRGSSDHLSFTPSRYEKTFRAWHENIRDWCISRQLWWGHRIPVWRINTDVETTGSWQESWGRFVFGYSRAQDKPHAYFRAYTLDDGSELELRMEEGEMVGNIDRPAAAFVCLLSDDAEFIRELEGRGYKRDPDVLDTWFSSALWPMSTMGWPQPNEDQQGLLDAFNPTSVLCTARDIITLWVSRMVMFNAYFLSETSPDRQGGASSAPHPEKPLPHGRGSSEQGPVAGLRLPFRDVYIHPMIQDGFGQRMSKSLGNGVDPMDIVHSHGADAMRFTLVSMATQTQDARLPVDCVDPHSGEAFEPETITLPNGTKVAAPTQTRNGRTMVTSYGAASGRATPTDDTPLARNTSEKFDLGQRLCNKLWNACRFAFSYLEGSDRVIERSSEQGAEGTRGQGAEGPARFRGQGSDGAAYDLPSRWVLSRLAKTVAATESALSEYRFSDYASSVYDFFWRDLCDWYIEAVKPTLASDASQRRVLASCLDATLRLMHPAMPFITERVWETLRATRADRGIIEDVAGLTLGDAGAADGGPELLMQAAWPLCDASLVDVDAEAAFESLRGPIQAIREARNTHKLKPRQTVACSMKTPPGGGAAAEANRGVIERLANVELVAIGDDVEQPTGSAVAMHHDTAVYLHDVVDADTERQRLTKRFEELEKSIRQLEGRLGNTKYVEKAPARLVQETRDQLADAKREAETLEQQLTALK